MWGQMMNGTPNAENTGDPAVRDITRVLVIDDDKLILDLVSKTIGRLEDYEVATASNGADGLKVYFDYLPHCVIVDVDMPVMDGFQFVRALRGHSASAHTPVIVLSAMSGDYYTRTGEFSGVDEYVTKPFRPSHLCATVERALRITPEERERRLQDLADEE